MHIAYKWENKILYRQSIPNGPWYPVTDTEVVQHLKEKIRELARQVSNTFPWEDFEVSAKQLLKIIGED